MDEVAPRALARKPFFFDGVDGASMPVSAVGHELGDVQD
jgi:hypothetical protein